MSDTQCNHQRIVFIASTYEHCWYGCDDCGFVFEVATHAMLLPERAIEYMPPHAPRPSDPVELMMARARGLYPETVAEKVAKFQPRSCGTSLSVAQLALVDLAGAASLFMVEWDTKRSSYEIREDVECLRSRLTDPRTMAALSAASLLRKP